MSIKLGKFSAVDVVAVCPVGCTTCEVDSNDLAVCTPTGCSQGWVYIPNQQCVGQFFNSTADFLFLAHLLFGALLP